MLYEYIVNNPDNGDVGLLLIILFVLIFIVRIPTRIRVLIAFMSERMGRRINKFSREQQVTNINPVNYNSKRSNRNYTLRNSQGHINSPDSFSERIRHYRANRDHPPFDSERYKQAIRLNLDYFMSRKYPFDYIVMSDRFVIEETRKGSFLTPDEQELIYLGYGYDGEPFGKPWGIEEECMKDYQYAINNHDFINHIANDTMRYSAFIDAGYDMFDILENINEDSLAQVENRRKERDCEIYERVTSQRLQIINI